MGIVSLFWINYCDHCRDPQRNLSITEALFVNVCMCVHGSDEGEDGVGGVLWHCCRNQIALPWRPSGSGSLFAVTRELRPPGTPSLPSPHPSSLRHVCGGVAGIQLGVFGTGERGVHWTDIHKRPIDPLSIWKPSSSQKWVSIFISDFAFKHQRPTQWAKTRAGACW